MAISETIAKGHERLNIYADENKNRIALEIGNGGTLKTIKRSGWRFVRSTSMMNWLAQFSIPSGVYEAEMIKDSNGKRWEFEYQPEK